MSGAGKHDRRWGDSEELVASASAGGSRRWLWVAAVVVLAAIAVGLLWDPSGAVRGGFRRSAPSPPAPTTSWCPPQGERGGGTPPSSPPRRPAPARPKPEDLVAEAKQVAANLLKAFPEDPPALVLAGRIYYAFNDVDRARECWQKSLRIRPQFAEASVCLGEAAWEHGEFDKAAEHLRRAWAANPAMDPTKVFLLADALMNLGECQEAARVLERAGSQRPLPPFGRFLLGHAYLELGEYEKARAQFEAVLAQDPGSINAHFSLATVYARLGQPDQARQHRQQYAQLRKGELAESARLRPEMRKRDWADPVPVARECCLNAGRIFAAAGRMEEAERHWLRAVALDPENVEPRQLLEVLYLQQGRRDEAAAIAGERPLGVR